LLIYIGFRARWPADPSRRDGRDRGFARLTVAGAGLVYLQMLVGSTVTGYHAGLAYPLNVLLPDLGPGVARIQLAHRTLAMVVGALVVAIWLVARRTQRAHPTVTRLAGYAAGLVAVQIGLGVANVANRLSALTVVPHLTVGALLWGTMVALACHADRFAGTAGRDPAEPEPAPARSAGQSVRAYFLLTKPRIIELLLVTTVPTMFIAARGVPSPWLMAATLFGGTLSAASANVLNCYLDRDIDALMRRTARRPLPAHRVEPADALRFGLVLGVAGFVWLWAAVNLLSAVLATSAILFYVFVYTIGLKRRSTQNIVIGGALSAASANVLNCYLDRDIDALMRRTARRPLPAHRVEPADALRFGLVLGVAGFAWLWATVNLLSAALATAAILFYVFVYTLGLKRRSTQNIVIGGAAGAVPVLVGWSAVTGRVELPALVLFAIIFYWTPPHFWALSLRYRDDYAAAGVPMLPVVRGARETSTQILYYTVLLVAVTLLLYPAGRMGAVYLAAAVALGGAFIWRALELRRDLTGRRAIRLFSFSNTYLALLFCAMAVDAVVRGGA
ncbi:MAG TPA: heme o synthase, partial [Actinomycetota bacterium]|nr:heme o synthase [Actinomycetota bacterium]